MADTKAYTTGGTVQAGTGVYIPRQADKDLLSSCMEGEYAYILAARQVGKSSLMVNVARELRQHGVQSAIVDLTTVGQSEVDAERWYLGILAAVEARLKLSGDVFEWWNEQTKRSYSDRFVHFFISRVLTEVRERVVVFLDEIDTTLELGFTDDFFGAIRYLYNARSEEPALARLSFVLIGVATPTDLIKDTKRTPFNIGRRIDLEDFSTEEALILAGPLGLSHSKASHIVERVRFWTGGHPYLTQRLMRAIAEDERVEWTEQDLDSVVERTFFGDQSGRDSNLVNVAARLSNDGTYTYQMLSTYANILRRLRPVLDNDQSPVKAHLKLSGVVARKGLTLAVRNEIYERLFDSNWVKEQRAIRHERVARRAVGVAVICALAAAVLAAVSWQKSAEARSNLADANRERILRKEAVQQQQAAEAQRKIAVAETQRADGAVARLVEALEKAGLSEAEAKRQAEIAVRQTLVADEQRTLADENSHLAADNAALAGQRQKQAEADQKDAVASRKEAEISAAKAQTNLESANAALADNRVKSKQLLVYKLISDANLMRATQPNEAALIDVEAYGLPDQSSAARADAIQGLEGALEKLPYRVGNPHWDGSISSLALNTDGSRLAAGLSNGELHVVRYPGGQETDAALKLSLPVGQIAFAGTSVVAFDQAGNTVSGKLPSSGGQRVLAIRSGGLAYVSMSPEAKVLSYWSSGRTTPRLLSHHAKVRLATFRNSRLYVLCEDNSITVWMPDDAFKSYRIDLPSDSGSVNASFFESLPQSLSPRYDPFGSFLLGSRTDLRTYLVDSSYSGWGLFERLKSAGKLDTPLAHDNRISAVAVSQVVSGIITTTSGSILHRWNMSTATNREVLHADLGYPVTALAVSGDDRFVATARAGGSVDVWLAEVGAIVAKHSGRVAGGVAFSTSDQLSAYSGNVLQTWNWRTDSTSNTAVPRAVFSSSSNHIFSANGRGLLEWTTTTAVAPVQTRAKGATPVATGTMRLTDLVEAKNSVTSELETPLQLATISPDGQFAVMMSGHQLRVYGGATFSFDYSKTPIRLAIGPQAAEIAVAVNNGVEVMGTDGKILATLENISGPLCFSRDGRYLAVATVTDGVHFFDATTWKLTGRVPQNAVTEMVFSPDGLSIATLAAGTARIWDTRTGDQIAYIAPVSAVSAIAFSPDGKYVATGGSDALRVWLWRPDDLVAEICSRVASPVLSPSEWKKYFADEPYHATCRRQK